MKHVLIVSPHGLSEVCTGCSKRFTLAAVVFGKVDPDEECPGPSWPRITAITSGAGSNSVSLPPKVCTCGAAKVGSPKHSSWC